MRLDCIDFPDWETPWRKDTCAIYEQQRYCENGGVTTTWGETWTWHTDSKYGLNAREACCVCGGGNVF